MTSSAGVRPCREADLEAGDDADAGADVGADDDVAAVG